MREIQSPEKGSSLWEGLPPENGEGLRPAKVPMREIQSPEKGSSLWEDLPPENGQGLRPAKIPMREIQSPEKGSSLYRKACILQFTKVPVREGCMSDCKDDIAWKRLDLMLGVGSRHSGFGQ